MKLRRVFALVPDCHAPDWRYGDVWRRHFYDGLKQAGVATILPHDVDFAWSRPPQAFDAARTAAARSRSSERLVDQILRAKGGPPQAVLSCCFSHDLDLAVVDCVRAAGIPWVNFFCDSLYAFDWVAALAARTSLNWFVESAAEARYRSLGVPILRAPYALNPDQLPDASCTASVHALLFVGTASSNRLRTASLLRLAGADLQVRGWGWKDALDPGLARFRGSSSLMKRVARGAARRLFAGRVGGYLDRDSMLDEVRHSTVVLGLNEGGTGTKAPRYLKLRDLEFPGMGCCYLAQHHPDLEETFRLGREVAAFRSPREGARLARELARHPDECRAMGRRARARVLQEFTWLARLAQLESRL